jgi:phosphate transport system substrate-binding protein
MEAFPAYGSALPVLHQPVSTAQPTSVAVAEILPSVEPDGGTRMQLRTFSAILAVTLTAGVLAACGGSSRNSDSTTAAAPAAGSTAAAADPNLSGTISVDGSSTLGPLTTAAAEAFGAANSGVQVTVGISGTGGGFEKFCNGETDLSDASRPIKDEEKAACTAKGITFHDILVANDGITVVVNKDNDWATCLTVDQLKTMWGPDSKAKSWKDIDPSFPDEPLKLYGPGTDSGTFDFFTTAINGKGGASRSDYSPSEDDNVSVQGVAGEKGGLGYFGLSYYEQNKDTLKAVQIDGGKGCVEPSTATVQDKSYTPLSRPLFVYAKDESLKRPEVQAFLKYYTDNAESLATTALFVPLTPDEITTEQSDFAAALAAVGA